MILSNTENLARYNETLPMLTTIMDWLSSGKLLDFPDGKHLLAGEQLYVNISRCATIPWSDKQFEGHERYIDVQCVLAGMETIGYAPAEQLETAIPYNKESDLTYFADRKNVSTSLTLGAGMMAIFFPEDAHKPGCICNTVSDVHKAVFKVLIK